MATNLTIAINTDTTDSEYGTSGIDWTVLDLTNDALIFTAGSDIVKDGEALPSQDDLNRAGIDISGGVDITVSQYLVSDFDANELKEAHLMGNQDNRYVMAFVFDGPTTSEPVLEVWDNLSLNTVDSVSLGAGTPANSWFKGVVTTSSSPGTNWTGTPLAGSSVGNFLFLNDGNGNSPLSVADTLYCNIKVVIPSTATSSGAETPVFACKYTTN